jgi:hypothetical protein
VWTTTGSIPASLVLSRNRAAEEGARAVDFHPLGFREKICTAVHPKWTARGIASSTPPAMETWTPKRIDSGFPLSFINVRDVMNIMKAFPGCQEQKMTRKE